MPGLACAVPDSQALDGHVLASHLGILGRPQLVDFDVHAEPWSWRKDRFSAASLRELWRAQLGRPDVSPEFPFGLYVHVPFCTHSCSFCRCFRIELHSGRSFLERYVDYVCAQIDFFAPAFSGLPLRYFSVGGGTPSILTPAQLARLFARIHDRFDVQLRGPISTFELSLPTAHDATLDALAAARIPRVSLGVQTLQPEIRRRSAMFDITPGQVAGRVAAAAARGLHCNLDLVLGLRGESAAQFLDGFRTLLSYGPSSVIVNLLNDSYFHRISRPRTPEERAAAAAYLREAGEGMAEAAARAGYSAYPHGNTVEAIAFFAPEFDRQVQPHREVLQRLAGGVLAVKVGTSVLGLGTICNLALLPDYLVACHDQEYEFHPDKLVYQCARREVFSILYPREEDRWPPFSPGQLAVLEPLVDRLRSSRTLEVMPSAEDILLEFADAAQADGRGRVFIRAFVEGRPCSRRVGSLGVNSNGARTPLTVRVENAVARLLERAGAGGV